MTKRSLRSVLGIGTLVLTMVFGLAAQTSAHSGGRRVVVTPSNTQGWSTADTRPGGAVNFVVDATAPSGRGALQLTTNATNAAKAQYLHAASTPLAGVTQLSYYTKQNSGPTIAAALSPDGRWLAYISQKGETGANEVWALSLVNGNVTHLGCSTAAPFTDRLAWSPDSSIPRLHAGWRRHRPGRRLPATEQWRRCLAL